VTFQAIGRIHIVITTMFTNMLFHWISVVARSLSSWTKNKTLRKSRKTDGLEAKVARMDDTITFMLKDKLSLYIGNLLVDFIDMLYQRRGSIFRLGLETTLHVPHQDTHRHYSGSSTRSIRRKYINFYRRINNCILNSRYLESLPPPASPGE
jgi:hypothetical protein